MNRSQRMRSSRKILSWSLQILAVVVIVSAVQYWRTRDAASGSPPTLSGRLLDGRAFSLDALPRPLLVHFWGTWCPICRMQQDTINDLARQGNVVTVALSSGTDDEIAAYLDEHGLDMPVLGDPHGIVARHWGVMGVPTSFIVDTDNRIRFVTSGYTTGAGLRLRLWTAAK